MNSISDLARASNSSWRNLTLYGLYLNASDSGDEANNTDTMVGAPLRFNLFMYILSAIMFGIACTSAFLNVCVLAAISRNEVIRAKQFIQNKCIANIVSPVTSSLDLNFLTAIFGNVSPEVDFCYNEFHATISCLASFVQTVCAVGLTLDRVYAVAKPLEYHTVGYRKWVRCLIIVAPWGVTVLVWLIVALLVLPSFSSPEGSIPDICLFISATFSLIWKTGLPETFVLVCHGISFVLYIAIFLSLRYQQTKIKKASETTTKESALSLAVTFFMTHLVTLCLYLPSPLYSVMNYGALLNGDLTRQTWYTTLRALYALYLCNCCIDPLILILRIPSIRRKLPLKKKPSRDRSKTLSTATSSKQIM